MTDTEQTSAALATRSVRPLTANDWQMIQAVSPAAAAARYFAGVLKPEQAAMIMLKGFELGLPLSASFEFIPIVEGKPSLSPRGALAIVRRSGELERETITEVDGSCTVSMKRRNGAEYSLTWTLADATKAGLIKPLSGWSKYPANMLRWRCVGFVLDYLFPDVIGGLKRADELGADLTENGDVIEANWQPMAVSQPVVAPPAAVVTGPTLDELVGQYGADRVMAAAGGGIPGTAEELATVAATLVAEGAIAASA